MPSITVRDVPANTRDALAARAAGSGRSLQEYLRSELIQLAERPDATTFVARLRERKRHASVDIPDTAILGHRDADRL